MNGGFLSANFPGVKKQRFEETEQFYKLLKKFFNRKHLDGAVNDGLFLDSFITKKSSLV